MSGFRGCETPFSIPGATSGIEGSVPGAQFGFLTCYGAVTFDLLRLVSKATWRPLGIILAGPLESLPTDWAAEGFAAIPVTPVGGSGSSPSDHLELRRPGGGQAITYAVDVRWRDVDAQQDGALSDLSLQGFGRFPW